MKLKKETFVSNYLDFFKFLLERGHLAKLGIHSPSPEKFAAGFEERISSLYAEWLEQVEEAE